MKNKIMVFLSSLAIMSVGTNGYAFSPFKKVENIVHPKHDGHFDNIHAVAKPAAVTPSATGEKKSTVVTSSAPVASPNTAKVQDSATVPAASSAALPDTAAVAQISGK